MNKIYLEANNGLGPVVNSVCREIKLSLFKCENDFIVQSKLK